MECRACGAEIAYKAIVCYRCGAATTDPVRRAVPVRPKRSPIVSLIVLVVLSYCFVVLLIRDASAEERGWAMSVLASILTGAIGYAFGKSST